MKLLVKNINTNNYSIIQDTEFDSNIHIDRSNFLIYIDKYSDLADYITIRNLIDRALTYWGGFNSLRSDEEKDVVLKYTKFVTITDGVAYLMNKYGITQPEAEYMYLQFSTEDIRKAADAFKERVRSPEFMRIIIQYLGMDNAEIFMDNCRNFLYDLTETAIIGTEYGNKRNGFMDYINDTGDYIGTGASTFFNLPTEQTLYDNFKLEITNKILGE